MKRIAVIALSLFLVAGTAALFASGQHESTGTTPQAQTAPAQPGWGSNGPQTRSWGELQTLTGKISLEDWMHPTLTSGSKEYELMVPSFVAYDAGVKDGDTVTVTGHLFTGALPPWVNQDKSVTPFWVVTATVGGKTYDLSAFHGPRVGYGPRGGYGPRSYGMMGYGYGPGMGYGFGR